MIRLAYSVAESIFLVMVKRNKAGKECKPSEGGCGPKHIPNKSHGAISGELSIQEIPDDLDEHGVDFWTRAVSAMRGLGILERMDWGMLYLASDAFSMWQQARKDVKAHGSTVMDNQGSIKRNPAFVTLEKSSMMVKCYSSELGITASARAKFGPVEESDPMLELMKDLGHAAA